MVARYTFKLLLTEHEKITKEKGSVFFFRLKVMRIDGKGVFFSGYTYLNMIKKKKKNLERFKKKKKKEKIKKKNSEHPHTSFMK